MSTVKFNTWQNTDGTENYKCRAWVNFDGTTNTGGNCDIRESGNVSTVADNGTGDYTVNFATAMPDANYSALASAGFDNNSVSGSNTGRDIVVNNLATGSVRIGASNASGGGTDFLSVFAAIFR